MSATLHTSNDYLLCTACGTQYPVSDPSKKESCKICDDPRQFVPPEGQSFTTLPKLRNDGYKNIWWQDTEEPRIWSVRTEPRVSEIWDRSLSRVD
jgi:hypothetical protein